MTVSLIDVIKENLRQSSTGDDSFYKSEPYYFKLVTSKAAGSKGSAGSTGQALFPLPIGPEFFEYTLPFAAEVTATEDGGAVAEENGIVLGQLVLEGTTGWKLKRPRDTSMSTGGGRFTGGMQKLAGGGVGLQKVSGQLHLWRLIGRCFDAYGALKQDPTLAHKTFMEFHSIKDDLHLAVVPRQVKIKRDKGQHRVTYGYNIVCDVLGKAAASVVDEMALSDGTSTLDDIKNVIYQARKYARLLAGTIDDLTAAMGDLHRNISNISGIVNDCTQILNATNDFLEGVKGFMDIPAEFMINVSNMVSAAVQVGDTAEDFPDKASRVMKDLEDTLDGLNATLKGEHAKSYDERASVIYKRLQKYGTMSDSEKVAAAAVTADAKTAGGTQSVANVFKKGGHLPGDVARADVENVQPTVSPGQYTGFYETTVQKGDTIQSLAQKHLGNSGQWLAIAMVNALKSPYLAGGSVRKPGTLAVGDPIAIPTRSPSGSGNAITSGNTKAGGSQIEEVLGVDIRLVKLANGKYGWGEDTAHGGTDVQVTAGVNNLVQGLEARMRTIQGEDQHFPNCGLPRLVGNDAVGQTFREARYAMEIQILQDPRIAAVERLEFDLDGDELDIAIDARVVGLDSSRTIPVSVS